MCQRCWHLWPLQNVFHIDALVSLHRMFMNIHMDGVLPSSKPFSRPLLGGWVLVMVMAELPVSCTLARTELF